MSSKHFYKYFQKYNIYILSATLLIILYACSATKKVPDGEYLLTKNKFKFTDGELFKEELPNFVSQKPNKKQLMFLPLGLWFYNLSDVKYDTILAEYKTYPSEMKNQTLLDSLFIKNGHPEYKGKNLFTQRFLHTLGSPPAILDQEKTETSANSIRKYLVYKGYWDAEVKFNKKLDSAGKKAQITYLITHKDSTIIKDYYYNIPDPTIKAIYEENSTLSAVKAKDILDQKNLENEVKRINEVMKARGFYRFNNSNEEIYFTADTLTNRKLVPVTMDIHKDSIDTRYKIATIGKIVVGVVDKIEDYKKTTTKDTLLGINFHKDQTLDAQYKTRALWLPIILKKGEIYDQTKLDLTKRNLIAMNNFTLLKAEDDFSKDSTGKVSDSIIDVTYLLKPLPKYEFNAATDVNYSQLLNLGISPSVDLTTRNIFGGAENLSTSLSGTFGSIKNSQNPDKRTIAYEIAAQVALKIPRLLVPFKKYYKLIPKRYSPTTSINVGASVQNNIGLGRINFNGSLNYIATVNDVISHQLSLFNTQLSLTQNSENYYDLFPADEAIRNEIAQRYFVYNPTAQASYNSGQLTKDQLSNQILEDLNFIGPLQINEPKIVNNFFQSLLNKDRQTQDVLISSIFYNYTYNEIGKKYYTNPFYFNAKTEIAGNIFSLFNSKTSDDGVISNPTKTIFKIPYSQFIKFDVDVRKYFTFFSGKHTLALRQFVGVGIPYGNSTEMPFVRSYFNGGSNDIRAWVAFGGLGPSDSQLDETVRRYIMENVKLTTSIEYRVPFTPMFSGAIFTDAGNIWSLKDSGLNDEFKFGKFLSQMGVGSGFGLRINVAYITLRLDMAYKIYNPNLPMGERWRFGKIQPLKPTFNLGFGYPF